MHEANPAAPFLKVLMFSSCIPTGALTYADSRSHTFRCSVLGSKGQATLFTVLTEVKLPQEATEDFPRNAFCSRFHPLQKALDSTRAPPCCSSSRLESHHDTPSWRMSFAFSCQTKPTASQAKAVHVGGISSQGYMVTALGLFYQITSNGRELLALAQRGLHRSSPQI